MFSPHFPSPSELTTLMIKSDKKNILIVDDHPVVRSGIEAILSRDPMLNVCCEAGSEKEAIEQALNIQCHLDLAIIDLSLSQESGFGLFRKLTNIHPDLRMLVFSLHDETVYAEKVLKAGAHGYLMKGEPSEKLLEAIHMVLNGNLYVSKNIHDSLLRALKNNERQNGGVSLANLSKTELIILELIGTGMTIREIGERLNRSPKTIDVHRTNIKNKLKISSNAGLIQYAIQWIA